jgi:SPP1 family predicted phage head-tail adaptor
MNTPTHLFNTTITLLGEDSTLSDTGGPIHSYTSIGTIAARVQVYQGMEEDIYDSRRYRYTGRMYCSPDASVTNGCRFTYGGRTFRVTSVVDNDFMSVFLACDFEEIK